MTKEKRINFKWIDSNNIQFVNKDKEIIGNEGCYLSGGCSDEVREAQRKLNSNCKKGAEPEMIYELNGMEESKNEKENN